MGAKCMKAFNEWADRTFKDEGDIYRYIASLAWLAAWEAQQVEIDALKAELTKMHEKCSRCETYSNLSDLDWSQYIELIAGEFPDDSATRMKLLELSDEVERL